MGSPIEYSFKSVSELVECLNGDLEPEEMAKQYDQCAAYYDQLLGKHADPKTEIISRHLLQYVPDRSCRILDVAAGTGLMAQKLHMLGYKNIDALDPSAKMLEEAKSKNIYLNLYQDFVPSSKESPISDDTYEVTVVCGGFYKSQMDETAFPELIRITKPGGYIIFYIPVKYADEPEKELKRLHAGRECIFHRKQFESDLTIGGDIYSYVLQKPLLS